MRTLSSVASITIHVALGAAVLFGTAKTGHSNPPRPPEVTIVFRPLEHSDESGGALGLPGPVSIPPVDVRFIPAPMLPKTGVTMPVLTRPDAYFRNRFRWSQRRIPDSLRRRDRRW